MTDFPVIFYLNSWPVSRILCRFFFFERVKTGFHHLSWHGITTVLVTTYPPALDEQPCLPVYMVFQPIRCTAPDVAIRTGELLPHLFTITAPSVVEGLLFSVTLLYPHGYLPVRKHGALCCPDFPIQMNASMEQPAAVQR